MAFKLTIEIVVFIFVICVLIGLSIWALCKKDNFSNEKKQKCTYCKDCPMPGKYVVGIDSLNNLNKMCNDPDINCDNIKIYIGTDSLNNLNAMCNNPSFNCDNKKIYIVDTLPEKYVVGIDSYNLNKMCNDPRINCGKIKIYIDKNWMCNYVAEPEDTIYSLTPMK